MTREQKLEAMLAKIVNRAAPARKAPSTEIMLQDVPAALLDQARDLLAERQNHA